MATAHIRKHRSIPLAQYSTSGRTSGLRGKVAATGDGGAAFADHTMATACIRRHRSMPLVQNSTSGRTSGLRGKVAATGDGGAAFADHTHSWSA
jgi:hypothetical protein